MQRGGKPWGMACRPLRDRQQDMPRCVCPGCGREQYTDDLPDGQGLCSACRRRADRREENAMTLQEMSVQYRHQEQALRGRIEELRRARARAEEIWQREELSGRILRLESLWREARDLAVLLEHYYDRGYRRNGHYTL